MGTELEMVVVIVDKIYFDKVSHTALSVLYTHWVAHQVLIKNIWKEDKTTYICGGVSQLNQNRKLCGGELKLKRDRSMAATA